MDDLTGIKDVNLPIRGCFDESVADGIVRFESFTTYDDSNDFKNLQIIIVFFKKNNFILQVEEALPVIRQCFFCLCSNANI